MARYYFLLSSVPTLTLGVPAEITFEQFKTALQLNLTPSDYEKVAFFLTYIDLRNIRAFWLKEPLDPRGNLSEKELEEALLVRDILPPFVFDFLDQHESLKDRLHFFSFLYVHFFTYAAEEYTGFLKDYFEQEREIRLVLSALRAKKAKRDIMMELQFEDPKDPLVAHIFAQKDMDDYEPPREYEALKTIFKEHYLEPKKMALAFLEYRFATILELEEHYLLYSIDHVLCYLARLYLWENWQMLDAAHGKALVDLIA